MAHVNHHIFALLLTFSVVSLRAEDGAKAESDINAGFYDPVFKEIEGWTIAVDPKLMEKENSEVREKSFAALGNHLQRIKYILPAEPLARIQQCRIWIELDNPNIKGMQYHWERGWLIVNKHDPRMVRHVHIPQARELYNRRVWAKHPYVILHELAHAYHEQVFGFDDEKVKSVYEKAKASKTYDAVLDHRGKKVRHYAMNNQMEYFAESSEAYLGVNDFYPFVRAELKGHDPDMYELLREIWGKVP